MASWTRWSTASTALPDGHIEHLDAVSAASDVGATYYATRWEGERSEPTRIPLDEQGDELAGRE